MLNVDKAVYKLLSDDGTSTGTTNMAVDGSTPVTFYRGPAAGRTWHIYRIVINVEDAGVAIRPDEFGDLPALTNGCNLAVQRDGATALDFTNGRGIKQNSDWGHICYDVSYQQSGGAVNTSAVQARFTFAKAGQPVVLNGSRLERLALVVNDDITGLEDFTIQVQGYEVS